MHYVGVAHSTGEEFDASYNRGAPLDFPLGAGRVIRAGTRRRRYEGSAVGASWSSRRTWRTATAAPAG